MKTVHLIGCAVLAADMKRIAADLQLRLKTTFLPAGLHDQPKELHARLQAAIDSAAQDRQCCRIVVGYGVCGRGTVGIRATSVPVVFPRVHDCIALFLGSDKAYRREFTKYPGTFYLTAGWQLAKAGSGKGKDKTIWIGSEAMGSHALRQQYGERGAERIIDFFSSWQKNYQRAAFIDTGLDPDGKYALQAREMAEEHGWRYEKIAGDDHLLHRLLTQDQSGSDIIVVPPGYCTYYSALIDGLDCAPLAGVAESPAAYLQKSEIAEKKLDKAADEGFRPQARYGLGVDAGGTYTDALIYDFLEKKICCKSKALTTKWDFSIGIDKALASLDQDLLAKVAMVSVSTTLATNAIVEGRGQKTGLIVMNNAGSAWGDGIEHSPKRLVRGYINISGQEIDPLDEDEVRKVVREMADRDGVQAFAISGFAGAVNPVHELRVKKIVEEETGMSVCCGHELSDLLDFTIRARTAVLNARIIPLIIRFLGEIDKILRQRKISAPIMVVKGDGTLMSAEIARERPVETILSGPAASVAGAKLLTGLTEAVVVDMGGTTSDIAEIKDDSVAVCGRGARVGGFHTHVKALDMRTIGLGGDSLIRWSQGQFTIGPNRVVPLVYAGHLDRSGIARALLRLDTGTFARAEQVVYTATAGAAFPFPPTEREKRIVQLLRNYPHTAEELASVLGLVSARFLPMERLEESALVQRCGLTPTDLLHVRGSFRRWDPSPAEGILAIIAGLCKKTVDVLVDELLIKVDKALALELLRHLFLKDCQGATPADSDAANTSPAEASSLYQHLIRCILEPATISSYAIKAELHIPVIGVGAPVGFFLPGAKKILNTEVVIPEDGDVANALGAITSLIAISRRLVIRPDGAGEFVIEGIEGTRGFADLHQAQDWAEEYLRDSIRGLGRRSGTRSREVRITVADSIVTTAHGVPLFLERVVTAHLTGSPDSAMCRETV